MKTFSLIGCIVLAVIGIALSIIGNIVGDPQRMVGTILMFWGLVAMIWSAAYWVVYLIYRKAVSQPPEQPKSE